MILLRASINVFILALLLALSSLGAQDSQKLVYADFEEVKDNRPVSNRGGLIQITSYQENPTIKSRFKGLEGSEPPAPEFVRIRKDDPNRAMAFDYELTGPNQYAGVGVEVHGAPDQDGKPLADDVSKFKYLTMQLYVTGVSSMRVEFMSKGTGIKISNGFPQTVFRVSPGFNTYRIPLHSISQPSWAEERVAPSDVLKKLTSISVTAFCQPCTSIKGTVVIDNIIFQN